MPPFHVADTSYGHIAPQGTCASLGTSWCDHPGADADPQPQLPRHRPADRARLRRGRARGVGLAGDVQGDARRLRRARRHQAQLRRRQLERPRAGAAGTAAAPPHGDVLHRPQLAGRAGLHEQIRPQGAGGERQPDRQPRAAASQLDDTRARPLEHEIGQGRRLLEELTGSEIHTVAIPYGAYNDAVLDSLRRQAYDHVYTSDGGSADPEAWLQPREHLTSTHTSADIAALLTQL